MDYSFQMVYDQKDFAGLARAVRLRPKPARVLNGLSRACSLFGGVLCLFFGAVGLWGTVSALFRRAEVLPLTLAVEVFLLLFGASLCFGRGGRLTAWLTWRQYPDKGERIAYSFYEDHFEEHTAHSDHRFDYTVIQAVLEDRERFFLFVNASAAHLLRKTDLTGGTPREFAAFLADKCGKTPVMIR